MTATVDAADRMNRLYRRQRHIYDLTRKYYLLGRDRLIARLAPQAGDDVLEIGCGTGRNLIVAARRYPHARFYGIDVSREMLATAREAIARARLQERVRVAEADATAPDPARALGVARFQRVFISFSLSMIPAWPMVLERAIFILAPGGELQLVDFGGQERLPRWMRAGLRRWLALFHVSPRDELEPALAALASRVDASLAVERPYRGYSQYAVLRLPAAAR